MNRTQLDSLLKSAHGLCREVAASDLNGTPLYLLPHSRVAGEYGASCGNLGYTSGTLDLLLKDQIGAAWQGRGPCLVINDETIVAELGDTNLRMPFHGVALHELAHVFQRKNLFAEWNPDSPQLQARRTGLKRQFAMRREPKHPWDGHDLPFIRAFLHLQFRAERLGEWIPPTPFCAGPLDGLSSATTYQLAFGSEFEAMADKPLLDIMNAEWPRTALHLFVDDLGRWDRENHVSA